mgnify:CR=1 FL=1
MRLHEKIILLIAIIICSIQFVIAKSKIPVNLIKIVGGDTDFFILHNYPQIFRFVFR